jgi:hypothetical protein
MDKRVGGIGKTATLWTITKEFYDGGIGKSGKKMDLLLGNV